MGDPIPAPPVPIEPRTGWQTTEFWVTALATLATVLTQFWPSFPQESLLALAPLLVWVITRVTEKTLGPAVPGKRAWATTEFWVGIGATLITTLHPSAALATVITTGCFIVGRVAVKLFKNTQIGGQDVTIPKP